MGTELQAISAGYPLMRYGLAEYNAVIDYSPKTENVKNVPESYRFIASNIKGCYVSWSRSLPSGEIRIGDDIYLSIPNGWDERLCYYPWYTGHRYWQHNQWDYPEQNYENSNTTLNGARNNENVYRYYHGNETNLNVYTNRNMFTDKLLVWYKPADFSVGDDVDDIVALNNPSAPTNKATQVRIGISIINANTVVYFGVKYAGVSSFTYTYNFGDGSSETFNHDSVEMGDGVGIYHIYNAVGEYMVDITLDSFSSDGELILVCDNGIACTVDRIPQLGEEVSLAEDVICYLYIHSFYKVFYKRISEGNSFLSSLFTINNYSGTAIRYIYLNIPNEYFDIYSDASGGDIYVVLGNGDKVENCTLYLRVGDYSGVYLSKSIKFISILSIDMIANTDVFLYNSSGVKFIDGEINDYFIKNSDYDFTGRHQRLNFYAKQSALAYTRENNHGIIVSLF